MTGFDDEYVCHVCVGDRYLKREIRTEGTHAICGACGKRRPGFSIRRLAKRVEDVLCTHFAPVRGDHGYSFQSLVEEHADVQPDVAEALTDYLSGTAGYRAARDGDENVFDSSVSWDDGPLDRSRYLSRWASFQNSVKHEARYYNGNADEWLDDIFLDLHRQANWTGEKVVSTWRPSRTRPPFVRGRVAETDDELKRFLAEPAKEVGPPPPGVATAGRMNAAGISVFYGAMDIETSRAETRPPVGANVVFASFRLVRPVRLLDLDALARIAVKGSVFDPDFMPRIERAAFLRRLGDEVSRPVMPRSEAFGYLPTQIVAEYLAQRQNLDGMIYRSTQAGGRSVKAGSRPRNIVLFNHAARVGEYSRGRVEIDVDLGWEDDDDADDSITIREKKLPPAPKKQAPEKPPYPFMGGFKPPAGDEDSRRVTLRYVPESLVVERIRATAYQPAERDVSTFRYSEAELRKWPF